MPVLSLYVSVMGSLMGQVAFMEQNQPLCHPLERRTVTRDVPSVACALDGLVMLTTLLLLFRIGRLAGRLPKELADDVAGSVLDCFRYVGRSEG